MDVDMYVCTRARVQYQVYIIKQMSSRVNNSFYRWINLLAREFTQRNQKCFLHAETMARKLTSSFYVHKTL